MPLAKPEPKPRIRQNKYRTPDWVTQALCSRVELRGDIWEPCAGDGAMADALFWASFPPGGIVMSDIEPDRDDVHRGDFLTCTPFLADTIITNPPYGPIAEKIVRRALDLTREERGMVCMLLPHEWDCADDDRTGRSRQQLFDEHPAWKTKITLCERICWIKGTNNGGMTHHAWYVWDWRPSTPRLGLIHVPARPRAERDDGVTEVR